MSNKYLKYKKKYLELKKIGGQFNIDLIKKENEDTYKSMRNSSHYRRNVPPPFEATRENIEWSKSDDYYLAFSRHNPKLSNLSSDFYEDSNTSFNEYGRYRNTELNQHRKLKKDLTINIAKKSENSSSSYELMEVDYLNLVKYFEKLGIWIFQRIPPSA